MLRPPTVNVHTIGTTQAERPSQEAELRQELLEAKMDASSLRATISQAKAALTKQHARNARHSFYASESYT